MVYGYLRVSTDSQTVENQRYEVEKFAISKDLKIDISSLNDEELKILEDAINKDLFYTDIELFYIDDSSIPNFGPDYNFSIENNVLIAVLKEKMRKYIE